MTLVEGKDGTAAHARACLGLKRADIEVGARMAGLERRGVQGAV